MRLFTETGCGYHVDLDDPETYENLPNTVGEIRNKLLEEIGYSYVYINYWHADVDFGDQPKRINKLIENFSKNEKDHRFQPSKSDVLWYQEQLFLFIDEIENMC